MSAKKKKTKKRIPKTVTMFGRKLKVKRSYFGDDDWLIPLGPGLPIIWVFRINGVCHSHWQGERGLAEDFEKALQCVEPLIIDHFKRLGAALGYDVED